ncbi:hypothetical protein M758_UG027400 [Ceratodon purpureus]|nr:hypothetical protein M758_UG027400 [Ceratodon purpureus]
MEHTGQTTIHASACRNARCTEGSIQPSPSEVSPGTRRCDHCRRGVFQPVAQQVELYIAVGIPRLWCTIEESCGGSTVDPELNHPALNIGSLLLTIQRSG